MRTGSTYMDIIEGKIGEWKGKIDLLNQNVEKASADEREKLTSKIKKLTSAVETATLQLHDLDAQENSANTLEIKDKILEIFNSIDKDLVVVDEKTPYML